MNVTIVCALALTVTVAVPAARLLLTSNPALGKVLTPVSTVPLGKVSEIRAGPAETCTGVLHVPFGAVPAEMMTPGVPATLKVKFVPTVTPRPATLQTCRKPLPVVGVAASINVMIVWALVSTLTVAVPVARLLLTNNPALGKVLTPASTVPPGIVSVTMAVPVGTVTGVLHVPAGAGPADMMTPCVPTTLKVKFVPTVTPAPATLQTCRKPLVGTALQIGTETVLESCVTAPFSAIALPVTVVPVVKVTLESAKMLPIN